MPLGVALPSFWLHYCSTSSRSPRLDTSACFRALEVSCSTAPGKILCVCDIDDVSCLVFSGLPSSLAPRHRSRVAKFLSRPTAAYPDHGAPPQGSYLSRPAPPCVRLVEGLAVVVVVAVTVLVACAPYFINLGLGFKVGGGGFGARARRSGVETTFEDC